MSALAKPPNAFRDFNARYPRIARAWELVREEAERGPLDERTARLVKLGVAIGAMREGAVHSAARKALASGVTREEVDQVVALAASTLGFPASVAIFTWLASAPPKKPRRAR